MKQFIKFFTASCLGTIIGILLLVFVFVLIAISSQPVKKISSKSVLKLDLSNPIPEKSDNVPNDNFYFGSDPLIGQHRIKKLIEHAKTDNRISGILLNTQFPAMGRATATSIFEAVQDFKESGKFVYAYGDFYSQMGYYLSTAADSIFMNPNGSVDIRGFSITTTYFKNLFDKLGIKMNVFYKGKYKGASETYRRDQMSEENRIQYKAYLEDIKSEFFNSMTSARNFPPNHLDNIANEFISTNSQAAMDLDLVDGLYYQNEFDNILKTKLDLSEKSKIKYVDLYQYNDDVKIKSKSKSKDRIAVIYAEGTILYKTDENGVVSMQRYSKIFDRIVKNKNIKGVVLRVNSPGGVAFVADNIWNEMKRIKNAGKYITVSMGDYAASGGYYIACMADTIVAERNTLTGSIGVFLMFPEMSKLFNEKLGINFDTVKTNPHAFALNSVYPVGQRESEVLQQLADHEYSKFLSRVAEGRNMTIEEVDKVAQGRIWSGTDAHEVGLVDVLGDLDAAIELTANRLDLEDYKIIEYPTIKKDIYREFMKAFGENMMVKSNFLMKEKLKYKKLIDYLESSTNYNLPQARLPEVILE